jgi:hypothetical protein
MMCRSLPFEGLPSVCFTTSDGLASLRLVTDFVEIWIQFILLSSELSDTTQFFLSLLLRCRPSCMMYIILPLAAV